KEEQPVAPRSMNRRVDCDLETICLKCLEKDPRQRYASAEAVAEDLELWLAQKPVKARAASRAERAWRWCGRHPAEAGLMAAGFAVLMFVLATGISGLASRETRLLEAVSKNNESTAKHLAS